MDGNKSLISVSTWHNPLYYIIYMFQVSFTKHKKWLCEMILYGHTKNVLIMFSHTLLISSSQLPMFGQCVCRWTSDQLLSMVSPHVCYVFVKRLCNNLPLYTTSPGFPYQRTIAREAYALNIKTQDLERMAENRNGRRLLFSALSAL